MSKVYTKEEVAYFDGGKTIEAINKELKTATGAQADALKEKKAKYSHDAWVIIHGKVYDVTKFLNSHPGGPDSIIASAGKDATLDFEDIHHSKDARDALKEYLVGKLEGYTGSDNALYETSSSTEQTSSLAGLFPIFVAVMAAIYYILKN